MIKHILFDLDSTLYSSSYGLEDNMVALMRQFLARYLCTSVEQAMVARGKTIGRYGTTLEWLMAEKGFTDIDEYMHALHPELRRFLESLPCPCSILTNSPGFHAERIIKKMELEGIFRHVFDIESNGYRGKPHPAAYHRALEAIGRAPDEVLFIDDRRQYAEGFLAIGGNALLFDEEDAHGDYPHGRIKDLKELVGCL